MWIARHGIIESQGKFLLDIFPNASTAYSLRKLRSNYNGNAIRVRRSSDNTEQDIGFTSTGILDESALSTFIGANSGFIRTWYDQSGNNINLSQTTNANQPRIVNAGTIDTQGGKPTIRFNGTSQFLFASSISINNTNGMSAFTVARILTQFNSYGILTCYVFEATGGSKFSVEGGSISKKAAFNGRRLSSDTFNRLNGTSDIGATNYYLQSSLVNYTSTTANIYINNILENTSTSFGSSGSVTSQNNTINIGAFSLVGGQLNYYKDANIGEVIYYLADQSSNRIGIESNINSYYSIY